MTPAQQRHDQLQKARREIALYTLHNNLSKIQAITDSLLMMTKPSFYNCRCTLPKTNNAL